MGKQGARPRMARTNYSAPYIPRCNHAMLAPNMRTEPMLRRKARKNFECFREANRTLHKKVRESCACVAESCVSAGIPNHVRAAGARVQPGAWAFHNAPVHFLLARMFNT